MRFPIIILLLIALAGSSHCQEEEKVECGTLSMAGPPAVMQPGETYEYKYELVPKIDSAKIEVIWTAKNGTIVSGHGSDRVQVRYDSIKGETLVVTVEISGPGPCGTRSVSEAGVVCDCGNNPILIDEWQKASKGDIKAHMDNLAIDMQDHEGSKGYIVSYGPNKAVLWRHEYMRWFVEGRGLETNRFVYIFGGKEKEIRTRIWLVPKGADASQIN